MLLLLFLREYMKKRKRTYLLSIHYVPAQLLLIAGLQNESMSMLFFFQTTVDEPGMLNWMNILFAKLLVTFPPPGQNQSTYPYLAFWRGLHCSRQLLKSLVYKFLQFLRVYLGHLAWKLELIQTLEAFFFLFFFFFFRLSSYSLLLQGLFSLNDFL